MSKSKVEKILMERDGISQEEAQKIINDVRTEIYSAVEDGCFEEAEDIMYSLLGLEMDYIMDII